MDINMKIHHDINEILQNKPNNKLQARADGYPDFKWTLSSQFDKNAENFNKLKKKLPKKPCLTVDMFLSRGYDL